MHAVWMPARIDKKQKFLNGKTEFIPSSNEKPTSPSSYSEYFYSISDKL